MGSCKSDALVRTHGPEPGKAAKSAKSVKSILISCFDSAPLGVDFEFILKDQVESFKLGLEVLKKITSGNLNIGLSADQKFLQSELNDFNKNIFSGPHPAGNVGIHIHHLDPISQGESVWVVKPEDVCVIGNLFKTGEYNPSRTIAVSGPPVKNPMYFKTTWVNMHSLKVST